MNFSTTGNTGFQPEIILSAITLIAVATICIAFHHSVLKKKATVKSVAVHHVVIVGHRMTPLEKHLHDQVSQKIASENEEEERITGDDYHSGYFGTTPSRPQ